MASALLVLGGCAQIPLWGFVLVFSSRDPTHTPLGSLRVLRVSRLETHGLSWERKLPGLVLRVCIEDEICTVMLWYSSSKPFCCQGSQAWP